MDQRCIRAILHHMVPTDQRSDRSKVRIRARVGVRVTGMPELRTSGENFGQSNWVFRRDLRSIRPSLHQTFGLLCRTFGLGPSVYRCFGLSGPR